MFGSAACGEAKPGSDLEELLGCKVDVVTERGLYWLLRRRILKQARAVTKDPHVYLAHILE